MKKSENIQITEFDKKANVHNMELLPVVCLPVYKEIVKEMAELIEDKQAREVFCSLSSGRDLQSVSQITGISSKNLVSNKSIYNRLLLNILYVINQKYGLNL